MTSDTDIPSAPSATVANTNGVGGDAGPQQAPWYNPAFGTSSPAQASSAPQQPIEPPVGPSSPSPGGSPSPSAPPKPNGGQPDVPTSRASSPAYTVPYSILGCAMALLVIHAITQYRRRCAERGDAEDPAVAHSNQSNGVAEPDANVRDVENGPPTSDRLGPRSRTPSESHCGPASLANRQPDPDAAVTRVRSADKNGLYTDHIFTWNGINARRDAFRVKDEDKGTLAMRSRANRFVRTSLCAYIFIFSL